MDRFGRADPHLVVSVAGDGDSLVETWRSEVKKLNQKPVWAAAEGMLSRLSPGGVFLQLSVYDWDRVGKDELIGTAVVSPDQLAPGFSVELHNSCWCLSGRSARSRGARC